MADLGLLFDPALHQALSNLDVALEWSRAGVPVFPCYASGEKVKCPLRGVFWHSAATTNERQIRTWWEQNPDALPALHLGRADLLVIDADGAEGVADWHAVVGDRIDEAPVVETPSGGEHRYFHRGGRDLGNGRGSLPPKRGKIGIDVRGKGGYVIAPGATLIDGRRYEANGYDILSAPEIPDWLVEVLQGQREVDEARAPRIEPGAPVSDERKRAYGERALSEEMRELASAPPGTRNETANLCAFRIGQLVGGGCLTEQEAYAALHNAAASWGIPANDKALGPRGTIARAIRDGLRSPRHCPDEVPDTRGAELAAGLLARKVVEAPDGTRADAETGEVLDTPDPEAGELPRELCNPPGLIGALADHICDTSRRPQRALAIGAALTIVGTLAGRHIAGPTGSGTHLYVVGLAPTGAGKDHALQQVLAAMAAADCTHLIGPGQFISMPAVINFLGRAPLSICAMDEFGSFLKRINSRRASGFEGAISGVLRTAWGSSFKPMPTPEWAGRSAQVILAPALSIYGVSTAEEFYGAMEGGDTSNGVLNRLLVVETRKRPKDRSPRLAEPDFPAALVDALKAIPNRAGPLVFSQLQVPDQAPPVHRVPWGPGAQAEFRELVEEINELCDGDEMAQAFYARVAETAVRLATILAIGCGASRPVVTADALRWGRGFAMWCARNLQRGGTEHIADSENQSTANAVRRAIREAGGRMKHRDLLRRLNHRVKNRDLIEVVKSLAEAEHIVIEKVVPEKGGTPTVWYRLA